VKLLFYLHFDVGHPIWLLMKKGQTEWLFSVTQVKRFPALAGLKVQG
jgi:hypothetical protein